MQIKVSTKEVSTEEVAELQKKLRRGDSELIAEMLDGLYKPITIHHMVKGYRTMKPIVFEAAHRLIKTIENLKHELK